MVLFAVIVSLLTGCLHRSVIHPKDDCIAAFGARSLEEYVADLELQSYLQRSEDAASAVGAAIGSLKHVVIITTGLEGAVLGGGIGTAYSALARRLAAFGHTVQIVYVPYPTQHFHSSTVNHSELSDLYSTSSSSSSIFIDLLLVTASSCAASQLFPLSHDQPVVYRPVRSCSFACIRSYQVSHWLRRHLRQLSGDDDRCRRDVIVHVQDNAGLGYFISQVHSQQRLSTPITLVLGGHAPHLWERLANALSPNIGEEDAEIDWMERSTAANVDWLISPSQYMLTWMMQRGWTVPSNVAVQPNILPYPPTVAQIRQRARDLLEFNPLSPLQKIVFFGRLEVRKGLFIFLDALHLLLDNAERGGPSPWKGGKLVISFLGPDTRNPQPEGGWTSSTVISRCLALKKRLMEEIDLSCVLLTNLSRRAALERFTDYSQSPPLAVMSSSVDNSPYTVEECLIHGVPFLAAEVGGIPELVYRYLQAHEARQHLFEPTARRLADKLQEIAMAGVRWLPMLSPVDSENAWRRWHRALLPVSRNSTSLAVSSAGGSRLQLAVCIIYPGTMHVLRSLMRSVFGQQGIGAYELQLVLVRLFDGSTAQKQAISETTAVLRSELAADSVGRAWSARLVVMPAAVSTDTVSNWQWIKSRVFSDYYLFLNPDHTLYKHTSVSLLMKVAVHTGANVTSAFVYYVESGEVELSTGYRLHAVHKSASDCVRDRSVLIRRSALRDGVEDKLAIDVLIIPEPLFAVGHNTRRDKAKGFS